MSLRELARIVADRLGSASRIIALSDTLARVQARILERLPGKPFSTDNFLSLSVHSICEENGFKKLGIKPRSLQAELPHTLGTGPVRTRYDTYREKAAR